MKRTFGALLLLLLLIAVGALLFIYSGLFNVAASEPHTAVGHWILDTTMKESVKRRARGVEPPFLEGAGRVEAGFAAYEAMCVICHGAPGVVRSELGQGLMPLAADLAEEAEHWTSAEIFWIVKHGIKMTGMPAWSKSHTDEELWDVVAFVEHLPSLSAGEYQAMRQRRAGSGMTGHTEGAH